MFAGCSDDGDPALLLGGKHVETRGHGVILTALEGYRYQWSYRLAFPIFRNTFGGLHTVTRLH